MKLFKKSKRMNNRGFSLVEILCVVAILGIATTAVGSAMIVSAQNYNRNNVEMEVQQEAQIATNLIGELLVDAYAASSSENLLKIKGDNVEYEVSLDNTTGELSYKEIRDDGATVSTGILAENVTKFVPTVPADFKKDKNVRIELAVNAGGKVYASTYNATARNGEVSNVPGVAQTATVILPDTVILEPGQEITIPVSYSGMTLAQMNGLIWDIPASADSFVESSSPGTMGNGLTLKIKSTAAQTGDDYFNIVVRTGKVKEDGVTPLAIASTTIKIRRVQSVNVAITNLDPANPAKTGTLYRVDANVAGYNFNQTTEFYDIDDHAYRNPYYVDFKISGTAKYSIVDIQEKVDNPYLILELTDDLYSGEQIDVTAIAVHPEGIYNDTADASATPALPASYANEACNKASVAESSDKSYGHVEKTESIIGQGGGGGGGGNFFGPGTGGFKRGDFEFWQAPFGQALLDKFSELAADPTKQASQYHAYWRFWETTEAQPAVDEGWMYIGTAADDKIELQRQHSMMFDVHKSYWIQVRMDICKTNRNEILWPITDEEKIQSLSDPFALPASSVSFKTTAVEGYENFSTYLGMKDTPIVVDAGSDLVIDIKTDRMHFKNLNGDFKFVVEKWNVTEQKYEPYGINGGDGMQIDKGFYDDADKADLGKLTIKTQPDSRFKGQKYRILTTIDYKKYSYNANNDQYTEGTAESVDMYNEGSGDGCIYIMFRN